MRLYLKIIILIYLLISNIYAGQIGQCSNTPIFLKRQSVIDSMILRLKHSPYTKFVEQQLINNFSSIGIENFIRYTEPVMSKIYKNLLMKKDFYIKYKSIYGIKNCQTFSNLSLLLNTAKNSTNILIKDIVYSTIADLNASGIINQLYSLYESEKNIYLKNSLLYSIKILEHKMSLTFPDFKIYKTENEPYKYIYYKNSDTIPNYKEIFSSIYLPDKEIPAAKSFIPPIINYSNELIFRGRRISFGVGSNIKHTGDDCGWFRDGNSVYAIGNGIIRLIHHSPDWGFLIVIEHKLKDNQYICSVYGHLSHLIYKKAGDIVKKGEKIGEIGLSYSIDNGGYGAHLHFGISKGRWLKSNFDYAKNLSVSIHGKKQKIKHYKFVKQGIELILENNTKVIVSEKSKDINRYIFWIKGYQFSKDIDRYWIDPQEFFKNH